MEISILFYIIDFNYEIINVEFENDNVWKIILKYSSLIDSNLNLKFFYLPNIRFESNLYFQMKYSFSKLALANSNKWRN